MTTPASGSVERLTAWVHGRVQGVGFRWFTRARALELGLVGHATNHQDGRVLVIAEGPRPPRSNNSSRGCVRNKPPPARCDSSSNRGIRRAEI